MRAIDGHAESHSKFSKSGRRTAIDGAISALRDGAARLQSLSLQRRVDLADRCAAGVVESAREWVEAACHAKRIPPGSRARAEEIAAGPIAVLRQLRLAARTLRDIRELGRPVLPGRVDVARGQLRVPVFPTTCVYDRLLFRPLMAETWLQPGVSQVYGENVARVTGGTGAQPSVVGVLGAGNVSSIPATDAISKILQENKAVLLKMNPVNEYLGTILERALSPLVDAGFLRVVFGGAEIGRSMVEHEGVDEVHITGAIDTHDAIVWGTDAAERDARRANGRPVLTKPITSELGNVTPWMVLPGRYSDRQLRFQAESIAASIVNNASFNCIATKVIITWQKWPDRGRFLDMIEGFLAKVPPRYAYYPGAADRFARFSGRSASDPERLPWTLIRDADPDEAPHLFERESFVCVCAESALDADSPLEFLSRAVNFMNERLWGTLAAAISVPTELQRRHPADLDDALGRLRYGTVGINQWPGVAYALMSPPWGGYPGSTPGDAQSGVGFVHNTFLLDQPQKTILRAPLSFSPKPIWFPTHSNPEPTAWTLLDLYQRPSLMKLPGLFMQVLKGTR